MLHSNQAFGAYSIYGTQGWFFSSALHLIYTEWVLQEWKKCAVIQKVSPFGHLIVDTQQGRNSLQVRHVKQGMAWKWDWVNSLKNWYMSITNIFLTISSKFHRQIKDALICDVIQIYKHRLDTWTFVMLWCRIRLEFICKVL